MVVPRCADGATGGLIARHTVACTFLLPTNAPLAVTVAVKTEAQNQEKNAPPHRADDKACGRVRDKANAVLHRTFDVQLDSMDRMLRQTL